MPPAGRTLQNRSTGTGNNQQEERRGRLGSENERSAQLFQERQQRILLTEQTIEQPRAQNRHNHRREEQSARRPQTDDNETS